MILINILLFFIVFAFRVPLFYNSTILALFIIIICLFFFKTSKRNTVFTFNIFKSNYFILLAMLYLLLIIIEYTYPILHATYDFSKPGALYSQIFSIVVLYLLALLMIELKPNNEYFISSLKNIFIIFFIQCFFVMFCFLSKDFNSVIEIFRSPDGTQYAEFGRYSGIKRLSLSGGQYFTLSAAWSIAIIFSCIYMKVVKTKPIKSFIILALMMFASMSAGRVSLVGVFFGFGILSIGYIKNKILSFGLSLISITMVIFVIINYNYAFFEPYLKFAFEFYYNWQANGTFSTESTSILKSMYFPITLNTFIFGDGMYMREDGLYYRFTDAGYMRQILFYGAFGSALNIVIDVFKLYLINKFTFSKYKKYIIVIGFSLFVIQIKGEVFNHIVAVQCLLYWVLFNSYIDYKANNKC